VISAAAFSCAWRVLPTNAEETMRTAFTSLLTPIAAVALAQEHSSGIKLNPPAELKWQDGPPSLRRGAKIAVPEGDPNKERSFVFRGKAPDGYRIPPHTHPKMERVTVISGTFNIGMGDKFDEKALVHSVLPVSCFSGWPEASCCRDPKSVGSSNDAKPRSAVAS
jgi:hypothetical protein